MPKIPRVAIVLLNWNTWEVTCDCLLSLRQLDYPNYQMVLVDNGSSNDSVEQLACRFPEVTIIRNSTNLGFAAGNNVGIRYALQRHADYVLLLNNDTVVSPSFLREMVRTADSDPRIGLLNPKIYYFDPSDRIWYAGGTFSSWRGFAQHTGIGHRDQPRYEKTRDCTFTTGCALLVNADVIRQVGFLDEIFFMVCEDTDWCIRTRNAGFRAVYVANAVIWHKESYTIRNTTGKWLRDYYNIRNSLLVARKHSRYYHWLSFSFFLAGTLLWRTGGYSALGQFDRVRALYKGLFHGFTCALTEEMGTAQTGRDFDVAG